MAKRYYFTNESGEWIGKEYIGNIRGARTAAKRLANELGEEIAINTCKEIEYVGEKTAGEEFARVCDADGDVMAVCSTPGAADAWCAKNGITGEIGEFEPYIELGTFNADGTFEVDNYSSIDEYSGRITLVNDYFQTSETVCPDEKNETVESVEVAEETTVPETEIVEKVIIKLADDEGNILCVKVFTGTYKEADEECERIAKETGFDISNISYVRYTDSRWDWMSRKYYCKTDLETALAVISLDTMSTEQKNESEPTASRKADKPVAKYQANCTVCYVNGVTKSLAPAKWDRRNSGHAPPKVS